MSQIKKKKVYLINNPTDFPVQYLDDANATAAASAATKFQVVGFSPMTKVTDIHGVVAARGSQGTKNVLTLTSANVTVGTITAQTIVNVFVEGTTTMGEAIYGRYMGLDGAVAFYQVLLQPGDTSEIFLAKLYNTINEDRYTTYKHIVRTESQADITTNASGTIVNNLATAITTLNLTAEELSLKLSIKVMGTDNRPSSFVSLGTVVETTPQFNGTNSYEVLKGEFTQFNRLPYSYDYNMIALPGAVYTSYQWSTLINNRDLGGGAVANQSIQSTPEYELYINENCKDMINDLADFLRRATTLSTLDASRFDAPVFYDAANPPVIVADADIDTLFKVL